MRYRSLFLVLLSLVALLATPSSRADIPAEPQSPRFLVHLLDYLAKDYGGAVQAGKVISPSEYEEQVEFSESALKSGSALPETKSVPDIQDGLKKLQELIAKKSEAAVVSRLARSIQSRVIEVSRLEIAPARWPNLARGRQLFAQNCVSCHGQTGHGDGAAAATMTPKPADFHDEGRMKALAPFQAFNSIRLGIPGTPMAPMHSLADKEVWDLAFYVVSLRHQDSPEASGDLSKAFESLSARPGSGGTEGLLRNASTSSDEKLIKDFSDRSLGLIALRLHSGDDDSGSSLGLASSSLDEALEDYRSGKRDSAKTKAVRGYLEGIEPVEPRLKANDPEAVSQIEIKMGAVRASIESQKPVAEVEAAVAAAKEEIKKASSLLNNEPTTPWVVFISAVAILLREGFEAVLIILALLGVIRAAGNQRAALWIHGGWISALALGGVAWFFSGWLMMISGAQREMLEAVVSLLAVTVLLYLGFWLHSQTEMRRWKIFIDVKVKTALEGKNLWGLAGISFVAVFREAFETVLFLRAVWLDGGEGSKSALAIGVFGSLLMVIVAAWALLRYSVKLPIRKVFSISSGLMAFLALVLTGKGLHSLQETGTLSITSSPIPLHWDLFGIFPTLETLIAQTAILGAVGVLWIYGKKPPRPSRY